MLLVKENAATVPENLLVEVIHCVETRELSNSLALRDPYLVAANSLLLDILTVSEKVFVEVRALLPVKRFPVTESLPVENWRLLELNLFVAVKGDVGQVRI
jgi:hypothetical protein